MECAPLNHAEALNLHSTFVYLRVLPGLLAGFFHIALIHCLRPGYFVVRYMAGKHLAGIFPPGCFRNPANVVEIRTRFRQLLHPHPGYVVADPARPVHFVWSFPLPFLIQGERVNFLFSLGVFNRPGFGNFLFV